MPESTKDTTCQVALEIAGDRMEAWISAFISQGDGPSRPEDVEAVLEKAKILLEENRIRITDYVTERIAELGILMGSDKARVKRFTIAKGRLPVNGIDGDFTLHESLEHQVQDWRGDAAIDHYTFNSVETVEQDKSVGTITRSTPGVDGFDVCGRVLTPVRMPREVELDQTVRMADDDSLTVLSNVAGHVVYANLTVAIDEIITVQGDVNFRSGKIDSTVNVEVKGTICDLFNVNSEGSITVGDLIEAADVKAKGDIAVLGGIVGRSKGCVEAEGAITAKFCNGAVLRAVGDIEIAKGVMNSQIRSESKLLVGQGSIIGGEVYGREGVEAGTFGSDANIPTSITVGIHPDVLQQAAEIDAELREKREAGDRLHQTLKPLRTELKRLLPPQRKQMTELLLKIRSLVGEIQEGQTRRDEILEAGRAIGTPYVLVGRAIHEGVSIRIGRRCTSFRTQMKGPIRIEEEKIDDVTELVAKNEQSGAVTVLTSWDVL